MIGRDIDVVRRAYVAFARRDLDRMLERLVDITAASIQAVVGLAAVA